MDHKIKDLWCDEGLNENSGYDSVLNMNVSTM